MKDAKDTIEVAQYRHKKNEQRFKETEEETNQAMDKLGRLELEITKSFGDLRIFLKRLRTDQPLRSTQKAVWFFPNIMARN